MLTFTQQKVHPLTLTTEQICIEDIAHSLSLQCRFGGHCPQFYSVAQHCVHVHDLMKHNGESDETCFWGLMHDAAEAYLVDVPRPVKNTLGGYREMERRVMRLIAEKFGLGWPLPAKVDYADNQLVLTEGLAFFGYVGDWGFDEEPLVDTQHQAWTVISPKPAMTAESYFLRRFHAYRGGDA